MYSTVAKLMAGRSEYAPSPEEISEAQRLVGDLLDCETSQSQAILRLAAHITRALRPGIRIKDLVSRGTYFSPRHGRGLSKSSITLYARLGSAPECHGAFLHGYTTQDGKEIGPGFRAFRAALREADPTWDPQKEMDRKEKAREKRLLKEGQFVEQVIKTCSQEELLVVLSTRFKTRDDWAMFAEEVAEAIHASKTHQEGEGEAE